MTNTDALREQVSRLIVENRNSLNDPTTNEPYHMQGIVDDVLVLIASEVRRGRIDELEQLDRRAPTHSQGNTAAAYKQMIEARLKVLKQLSETDGEQHHGG